MLMPFIKRDNIVHVRVPTRLPTVTLEAASQTGYKSTRKSCSSAGFIWVFFCFVFLRPGLHRPPPEKATPASHFGVTFKPSVRTGCCVSLQCSAAVSHHSHCLLLMLILAVSGGKDKVGPSAASSEDGLSDGRANAPTRPSYNELSAGFKPDRRTLSACQPVCLSSVPNRSYNSTLIAFTFHRHFSRKSLLN